MAAIEETFPSCEFGEIFVIATKLFFHPEQRVGEKRDWLLNRIIEISPSSLNNNTLVYNEDQTMAAKNPFNGRFKGAISLDTSSIINKNLCHIV